MVRKYHLNQVRVSLIALRVLAGQEQLLRLRDMGSSHKDHLEGHSRRQLLPLGFGQAPAIPVPL
jgi:hypothetical protein